MNFLDVGGLISIEIKAWSPRSGVRFRGRLRSGRIDRRLLCPSGLRTFTKDPLLNTWVFTCHKPQILRVQFKSFSMRIVKRQFWYSAVGLAQTHSLQTHVQKRIRECAEFEAFDLLKLTKILKVNLASDEFKLSEIKQYKSSRILHEDSIKFLNVDLWQMLENVPLDPPVDVLRAESSMVKSPITWSYLAIDGDGGNRPVEFELVGRDMEELNAWVEMVGCRDDVWEG